MLLKRLYIRNFMGIKEQELEPGDLTVLSGENAAGKTSILKAIQAAFDGIDDDDIRYGEEEAEVYIQVDDLEIRRSTEDGPEVRKGIRELSKPATFLRELRGSFGFNPVSFIQADSKSEKRERRNALLEAAGAELEADELDLPDDLLDYARELDWDDPLDAIEQVYDEAYSSRRAVNSRVRDLEQDVEGTENALQYPDEDYDEDEHEELKAEAERLQQETGKLESYRERRDELKSELSEVEAAIERLQERKAEIEGKLEDLEQPDVDEARVKAVEERLDKQEVLARESQLKEQLESKRERLEAERETAKVLDDAVNYLRDEAPALLADKVDLGDWEVALDPDSPEEVYLDRDGDLVNIDKLSSSERLRLSVEVARRTAGDLGLILIDGFETLDEDQQAALIEQAESDDYQYIITRVGEPQPGEYAVEDGEVQPPESDGGEADLFDEDDAEDAEEVDDG